MAPYVHHTFPMRHCSATECKGKVWARGLCQNHYRKACRGGTIDTHEPLRKRGRKCTLNGCEKPHYGNGLCNKHWARQRRHGDPDKTLIGPSGGGSMTKAGYKLVHAPGHPNAYKGSRIMPEHRLVMSEHLGRALLPHENVHHINGDRSDNRIENLELWSKSQPIGQRIDDKVAWAKEILDTYNPGALNKSSAHLWEEDAHQW